jgi:asparagine synthase (glutamine-hydrolysing)
MGGIAGIFHIATRKPVDPARVGGMARALAHRGVDPGCVWTGPGVGLCGDAPPATTEDGALRIILDGRIGNAEAVRGALEAAGARLPRYVRDGALLLHAWRRWGVECLPRIEGAFAFALHDAARGALWLVRDRLGAKPLHHAILSDGAVLFASELKGVLAHPLLRTAPDISAIEAYLALGYVPDDACLAEGVSKLPAGHHLVLRLGHPVPSPVRWWALGAAGPEKRSAAALADELGERMRAAIGGAMPRDEAAGAFLPNGVDAAAVVALMAERSPGAIETCAIGYDDKDGAVPPVAARFATHHRHRTIGPGEGCPFDEPFADPSAWGTARLCALAREAAAVALAGDGGEDVFAGHPRHLIHRREDRVRRFMPARALRAAGLFYPPLGRSADEAYATAIERIGRAERASLYSEAGRRTLGGYRAEERTLAALRAAPGRNALDRAHQADCSILLPGGVLALLDRAGMAVGLDVRAPWADAALVSFLAALPTSSRSRATMKRALRRSLPRAILDAPEPDSGPPVSLWLRGAFADEVGQLARGSALAETGWFDAERLARLAAEHAAGSADHGRLLWPLLMLDHSLGRLFGLGPRRHAG